MCHYWKKQHTCNHTSDRVYIGMCRPGFLSNTVCQDIRTDSVPRPSHFPCWSCIKQSVHSEAKAKHEQAAAAVAAASVAREAAARQRAEEAKRVREERVRREAREKAERERVVEQRVRVEREREAERARSEGGRWMVAEAGSGKKKKVRGGVTGPSSPTSRGGPASAGGPASGGSPTAVGGPVHPGSPASIGGPAHKPWKENDRSAESSGRAGTWGPKKILSRKEGAAGLASVVDEVGGAGAKN